MRALNRYAVGLVTVLGAGCIAEDPRPPPGNVVTTASSDAELRDGLTTMDGWTLHYDRFLASLGHVSPEGDLCTFYSDSPYNRVLDMRIAGPQKVSILYALGSCELDFEVSSPWEDSVLGEGVTAADLEFMRTPASDDEVNGAGVSVHVEGTASSGDVQKRFAWSFRNRIDYTNCYATLDGALVYGVDLEANESEQRDLTVHGAVLFQDHLDSAAAELRFAPFVMADDTYGDADGEITLAELGDVPLADLAGQYADGAGDWSSFEHYVYRGLFARVVRYQGDGACEEIEVFPNDRTPH
jgi:hypothetical protein